MRSTDLWAQLAIVATIGAGSYFVAVTVAFDKVSARLRHNLATWGWGSIERAEADRTGWDDRTVLATSHWGDLTFDGWERARIMRVPLHDGMPDDDVETLSEYALSNLALALGLVTPEQVPAVNGDPDDQVVAVNGEPVEALPPPYVEVPVDDFLELASANGHEGMWPEYKLQARRLHRCRLAWLLIGCAMCVGAWLCGIAYVIAAISPVLDLGWWHIAGFVAAQVLRRTLTSRVG